MNEQGKSMLENLDLFISGLRKMKIYWKILSKKVTYRYTEGKKKNFPQAGYGAGFRKTEGYYSSLYEINDGRLA